MHAPTLCPSCSPCTQAVLDNVSGDDIRSASTPGIEAYSALCWGDVVAVDYEGVTFHGRVVGGVVGRPGWFTVDFSLEAGKWDLFDYMFDEVKLVAHAELEKLSGDVQVPKARQPPQSVVPIPNRDGAMPAASNGTGHLQSVAIAPSADPTPKPAPTMAEKAKSPEELAGERKAKLFKRLEEHKIRRQEAARLQRELDLKSPCPNCYWSVVNPARLTFIASRRTRPTWLPGRSLMSRSCTKMRSSQRPPRSTKAERCCPWMLWRHVRCCTLFVFIYASH